MTLWLSMMMTTTTMIVQDKHIFFSRGEEGLSCMLWYLEMDVESFTLVSGCWEWD